MLTSRSEICAEVELPRSSLHNIDYPYEFPSPPDLDESESSGYVPGTASAPSTVTATPTPGSLSEPQLVEELYKDSWFYYLSEISLLRLSSRVNHTFYSKPSSSWVNTNLLDMINDAWDFEKQIERWKEVLPSAIFCPINPPEFDTITELQLASWTRCANVKLRLYRPFLYRLASHNDQDLPLRDALQKLAESAVLVCLDPLFTLGLRHRHAGTWYQCRDSAARASMLIFAKKIGLIDRMGLGVRAETMIELCVAHLRYWEGEADDLRMARQIIERAHSE